MESINPFLWQNNLIYLSTFEILSLLERKKIPKNLELNLLKSMIYIENPNPTSLSF